MNCGHFIARLGTQDRHENQKKVQRTRQGADHQACDGAGLELVQDDRHDIRHQGRGRRYECEHSCKECERRASSRAQDHHHRKYQPWQDGQCQPDFSNRRLFLVFHRHDPFITNMGEANGRSTAEIVANRRETYN